MKDEFSYPANKMVDAFLAGKPEQTLALFHTFLKRFSQAGPIELYPTKSMIGISKGTRRIAWITQLGKNFIHIVFPFPVPYPDNLCFQKIARVPGTSDQYNHHLRIFNDEDINDEVKQFMQRAYEG